MFLRIIQKLESSVFGAAFIIATAQVASRLLGLFRERLLASRFGAGEILDMYYAAFKIPDVVFTVVVIGALSSSFIPIFIELKHKQNEQASFYFANAVLTILTITLCIFGVGVFFFSDILTFFVAPGFEESERQHVARLMRIMYLGVLCFGVSNVVSGVLNSFRKFIAYSLAPIFYNIGIIIGIIVLEPRMGIEGLAWGVTGGAFLHVIVQLPSVWKVGYRIQWIYDVSNDAVRKMFRLMIPRALALGATQMNQVIMTGIASVLPTGSVAVFHLANHLQYFPISVVGVSLAVSSFPVFSKALGENNNQEFISNFSSIFRRILFLIVPVSILVLLLRAQIVRLTLGSGNFNWEDTVLTAKTLGFFSVSMFAESFIPLLTRSFFALHNTKTPFIASSIAIGVNVAGASLLGKMLGVHGLALAFSISSFLHMMLLLALLRNRVGDIDDTRIIHAVLRILGLSLIMGIVVQGLKYIVAPVVDMKTFIGVFTQTLISGGIGAFFYLFLAMLLRFEEASQLLSLVSRIRRVFRNSKV